MFRRHPKIRCTLVLTTVVLVGALAALGIVVLPVAGLYLTVSDPLEPSDAIFVLEGRTPAREIEAATLYHRRYAPRVVLTLARDPIPAIARRLAGEPMPQMRAQRVLQHAGVPADAIVRLSRVVENTDQELAADFDYARASGFRRVILVTSAYHTRRVKVIWASRYGRALPALVHPTPYEHWDPARWWRSRHYVEWTVHELFGILNFQLGAPLRTFAREE
jgi:uncharacterized SAM-binding protein YcdF (DUF218 family)